MATAAELLAGVVEVDRTLVIDSAFRTINIPSSVPTLGVEHDDDVLRLNFRMPRYVSNTDLSGFAVRINYINSQGESDVYTVKDVVVSDQYITFTWLVGPTAVRYKGNVKFNVCAKTLKADGKDDEGNTIYVVDREFNTTIATLPVLEGLEAEESVVSEYSDLIEQWRRELFGIGDTEEASIRAVSQNEQEAIEAKGAEVLATIPAEYTETAEAAQEGVRTKADAIICSPRGEVISVSDSSDDYIRGLKIFGKTTQAADPTPDSPQDLVNIAANNSLTVCVYGKNLLPVSSVTVDNHQAILLTNPLPVGKYTFRAHVVSNDTDRDLSTVVFMNGNNNVAYIPLKRGNTTYTFNAEMPINKVDFCAAYNYSEGTGDTATWTNIQLECGENVTDYESYREEQSIAMTIEGGLPGIPVTTTGNYTDANGQQWVCDEVDFERGVYIQRVYALVSDYDSGWKISGNSTTNHNAFYRMNTELPTMIKGTNKPVVCTHFTMTRDPVADHVTCVSGGLSNQEVYFFVPKSEFPDVDTWTNYVVEQANAGTPITTYYILNEPIETPLSEEEIAAFKAIRTNYPNTTVLNDAGATMELSYNADTKTYIEQNSGAVSDEQIESVIEDYLEENPIDVPPAVSDEHIESVIDNYMSEHPIDTSHFISDIDTTNVTTWSSAKINDKLGSIETALDSIIEIQNNLIGGDGA